MKESLLALGSLLIMILSAAPHSSYPNTTSLSNEDTTYLRVITERAGKIVATLGLPDSAAFLRVRGLVADQYRALNDIYTDRDNRVKAIKDQQPAPDKAIVDSVKKMIQQSIDVRVSQLHSTYLTKLAAVLNPQQIDKVKDGMTYSVLEVTYNAYLDELPGLTDDQKGRILADLTEAREHAMDAESSEKKHAWFGKYKGRINNYLSSQGIDMKKAQEEWQKRLKDKEAAGSGGANSK